MARANRNSRFLRGLGFWSWRRDLNPRPSDYKSDALPAELRQPGQPHTPVSKDTKASSERGVQIERLSHAEAYCNALSGHLKTGISQRLRSPIGVGKAASGKYLNLPLHVICNTANFWLEIIQQEICGAWIPVIRKADTAGVYNGHFGNFPSVRPVDMGVNGNRLAERPVGRFQFLFASFRRGGAPETLGTGMHQRHRATSL